MNWIERLFVRAKHWQIFLLFVAVFAIGHFPIIGNFIAALKPPEGAAVTLLLAEIATVPATWCFLLWLWSLGSFLSALVPPELRLKKRFFLLATLYLAIYAPVSIGLLQIIDPEI